MNSEFVQELKRTENEQRFLFCTAFSVYEVVHVACLSHCWFAYVLLSKQTNYVTEKPRKRLRKR